MVKKNELAGLADSFGFTVARNSKISKRNSKISTRVRVNHVVTKTAKTAHTASKKATKSKDEKSATKADEQITAPAKADGDEEPNNETLVTETPKKKKTWKINPYHGPSGKYSRKTKWSGSKAAKRRKIALQLARQEDEEFTRSLHLSLPASMVTPAVNSSSVVSHEPVAQAAEDSVPVPMVEEPTLKPVEESEIDSKEVKQPVDGMPSQDDGDSGKEQVAELAPTEDDFGGDDEDEEMSVDAFEAGEEADVGGEANVGGEAVAAGAAQEADSISNTTTVVKIELEMD